MNQEIYITVMSIIMATGLLSGIVWLSVRCHLEKEIDIEHVAPALAGPTLLGLTWPAVPFVLAVAAIGYFGHKGIGLIVKRFQRPKPEPEPQVLSGIYVDPDIVDANREVEELLQ